MKITNSLLQAMGLALMFPGVTSSCASKEINITQRQTIKMRDTLAFSGITDTLRRDTLLIEDSGDSCPACGRG